MNGYVRLLYGQRITDEATCYKAFRTELLKRLDLKCERFEFCPEVTAKLCRLGVKIQEVPIRYHPRTRAEGKKIGWRDGLEAIWTMVYWRFARFRPRDLPAPTTRQAGTPAPHVAMVAANLVKPNER